MIRDLPRLNLARPPRDHRRANTATPHVALTAAQFPAGIETRTHMPTFFHRIGDRQIDLLPLVARNQTTIEDFLVILVGRRGWYYEPVSIFLKRESVPTASDEDAVTIRCEADNPQLEQCARDHQALNE